MDDGVDGTLLSFLGCRMSSTYVSGQQLNWPDGVRDVLHVRETWSGHKSSTKQRWLHLDT